MGVDPPNKFGSRLPLRLIGDTLLLRFAASAFLASGFRVTIVKGLVFRIIACAIMFRFETRYWSGHPVIVVCPFRFGLHRKFFGFCPITNRSITLLSWRKIARLFRLSFGFKSSRRVIADWSPVWFNFRPITAYTTGLRVAPNAGCREQQSLSTGDRFILWITGYRPVDRFSGSGFDKLLLSFE